MQMRETKVFYLGAICFTEYLPASAHSVRHHTELQRQILQIYMRVTAPTLGGAGTSVNTASCTRIFNFQSRMTRNFLEEFTMGSYDDDYDDDRFQNQLAAYKPRAWKQETALDTTIYSKPEPTSKTRIPSKNSFANTAAKPADQPHI